jgi:malonyl CoA-acyl carrier protein transacylase
VGPEAGNPLLKQFREIAIAALEERRGLVVYTRMDAQEMDRLARQVERDALERIRAVLPNTTPAAEIAGVRGRLERMDEQIRELDAREDIPERSRQLERDDITWRTFEEVVWLLGIE